MTVIKANVVDYNQLINDFKICVDTYKQSIDSFFTQISQTKGWVGDKSKVYLEAVENTAGKYLDFGESLDNFCDILTITSNSLTSCMSASSKE